MFNQMQDFVTEQMQAFTGRAQQLKDDPLTAVREGVSYSAETVEAFKQPVRFAARSSWASTSSTPPTAMARRSPSRSSPRRCIPTRPGW